MLNLLTRRGWDYKRRPMTDVGVGWIAFAISLLAGSTYSVFAKMLSPALSPLSLIFVSECVVLLSVLLSFGAMPTLRAFFAIPSRDAVWLFVIGCFNGIIGPGLWFLGLGYTSVVNASFFGKCDIVFMLLCAWFVFGERITRVHMVAICTILAGMTIISLRGFSDGLSFQPGDIMIVGGTLSFALSSVLYRKYLPHMQAHVGIAARSVTAIVAFFLLTPFVHHTLFAESLALPAALLPALIGFGFISRFLNGFMFYEALERLPVASISLVGSVDVLLSTTMAFVILGEPILWYHFLGGAFIILGTLLLEVLGTHPTEKDLERHLKHKHR